VLTRIFRPKKAEVTRERTISFMICKVSEVNNVPFFRVELHHIAKGLFGLNFSFIIDYASVFH
jgi:hypothetical protein